MTTMRPYVDCHNHIGRTLNRLPPTGQSTAMCLARFAETNVYASLSMPTATGGLILRGLEDIRDQNRVIARARRDFPQQVPLGLALVEPCLGPAAVDEAEWALSELGLHGIVSHPPVREACIPFVEMAAARGGLCNVHQHDALFGEIARMFPGATFITHASSYAAEHFAGLDNVWFEVVQYPDERGSRWDFAPAGGRGGPRAHSVRRRPALLRLPPAAADHRAGPGGRRPQGPHCLPQHGGADPPVQPGVAAPGRPAAGAARLWRRRAGGPRTRTSRTA